MKVSNNLHSYSYINYQRKNMDLSFKSNAKTKAISSKTPVISPLKEKMFDIAITIINLAAQTLKNIKKPPSTLEQMLAESKINDAKAKTAKTWLSKFLYEKNRQKLRQMFIKGIHNPEIHLAE